MVLLHHLMIIYAGTGNWFYTEGMQEASKAMQSDVTEALGGWFCAINQAYFMGLFLLISAYFVPGSYDRKGAGRFLKDRLIRLGIPLALYSWVINPVFVYIVQYDSIDKPFWRFFPVEYFRGGLIGHGPLWFIEVLLIFSLVYVLYRLIVRSRPASPAKETRFPSNRAIVVFALLLGLAGFLVRGEFVMDEYNFQPLNLQIPFFAQYIALFVVGLIAFRRNWLVELPDRTGRLWLRMAVLMVILWAPMMVVNGAINDDNSFKGGWCWQSLVYALWESFLCLSMCIGLVYLFRRYFNRRGKIAGFLVPNAYTAYLIHAVVITALAFAFQDIALYPQLKWVMVALVAVPLCFGISALIRKLPYTDRVL
ncbi:MAG: acyltransferase family protein [Dehalococcoidia bacterium]|nr:acyltransferase family protein [Dehalococcoidia bacterium]